MARPDAAAAPDTAGPPAAEAERPRIALVAPRNMRFSPTAATSIDLHIHETARWSGFRANITVFAEEVEAPFTDVRTRFWPQGRSKGHLERLLEAEKPDLIVAHQHLPTAARLAARFRQVPVALVRHNFQNPPRNFVSGWWKRRVFNRLSAIAFVSQRCRESFEAHWPGLKPPVWVTPNGVDSRLWSPAPEKSPILLFAGRLAPEKGVLEAALGIEAVLAERPDWRAVFIIASSPDHADYAAEVHRVLARAGDRVEIVEDARHEQVRRWMAQAAIAVAPTQGEESFGRVAVEAMASGAAVVASRASGFIEVVGDAGILLEAPQAEAIHTALRALIDDPARREALSAAGRARVAERYDLARSVVAFDRMAEALLVASGALPAPPPGTAPED
ncbi:glycosyltransferase family 4 protein [Paralimibaculum aggregatum]|nr:glycosyltransferase family 4 protein [Limibaculum sp. NKW23]